MSANQDRQGVRTPADIERKYDLSGNEVAAVRTIAVNAQRSAERAINAIGEHNVSESAHADIRQKLKELEESGGGGGGGTSFTTDETLILENGVLRVNTAQDVEQDNTLPITSAAVYTEIGNIDSLLKSI